MGDQLAGSAARTAARYAATFAYWAKNSRHPIAPIPAAFMPMSPSSVARLLPPPAYNNDDDIRGQMVRACCAATLVLADLESEARPLVSEQQWREYQKIRENKKQGPDKTQACNSCSMREATERDVHGRFKRETKPVTKNTHNSIKMDFNPDSLISEAKVEALSVTLHESQLEQLMDAAFPLNWKRADPDFFDASDPVRQTKGGGWEAADPTTWKGKGPLYMREIVSWNVNGGFSGEVQNILRIDGLTNDGKGDERKLCYRYRLEDNYASKMFGVWEPGGLDVDNGLYELEAHRNGKSEDWTVDIHVEKRVRYVPVRGSVPELVALTNYLAPVLVRILVAGLVNEGIEQLKGEKANG